MTISYSRGSDTFDAHPEQRTATDFSTFCEMILADRGSMKGQQYICASMADGHRCKASAQPRRWIGLDLDGCTPEAFARVLAAMGAHSALVYTTASHTPTAPRARVVVELAFPADRASAIATSKRLRESFGPGLKWDESCDKAEQPLFLPLHGAQAWRFAGKPAIPAPVVAPLVVAAPVTVGPAHPLACRVAEYDLDRACDDLRKAGEGGRNNLLAGIAHRMGRYVGAARLEKQTTARTLLEAVATWGEPDKSCATVDRQISEGAREPLPLDVPDSYVPALASRTISPVGERIRNAAALMTKTFKPVQWAVQDIVPEGVTIIAGAPKSGKSFLVLQWAFAIATGCALWNGRAPEVQGRVLYLALEDKDQRMQRRLEKLKIDRGAAHNVDLSRLDYAVEWDKAETGVAQIRDYLLSHPDCRMVIIDTISTFRNTDPGRKSAYAHDYEVGAMMKPLGREFNVAVVLVSHTRKQAADDPMDEVSGTQGMTGSVDNVLTLRKPKRATDDEYSVLNVDGRDIENPSELALSRNTHTGFWSCLGRSEDVSRTNESQAVLKVLATIGMGSPREIHAAMGEDVKLATVTRRLARMAQRGEISRTRHGQYVLTVDADDLPDPPPINLPFAGNFPDQTAG